MRFEIKHRFNGSVLFSIETDSWKLAVEAAIKAKADLTSANLTSADLTSANLRSANLRSADLTSANLRSADLTSADLTFANLRSADLRFANLRSANLTSADLTSANLTSANLRFANLRSANLTSANLTSANLTSANLRFADLTSADLTSADLTKEQMIQFRDDLWAVLSSSPKEVNGLRNALVDGKVDGSTYEGECACLVGTLANVAKSDYRKLPILKPDSGRPAEVFFTLIKKGDTPKKSKWSKLAVQWIDEWIKNINQLTVALK